MTQHDLVSAALDALRSITVGPARPVLSGPGCHDALVYAHRRGVRHLAVVPGVDTVAREGAALLVRLEPILPAPHQVIGGQERPYLKRWYIQRTDDAMNVYLHQFLRDDDDRALHDHPWESLSIMLRGRLREVTRSGGLTEIHAGDIVYRAADHRHRIELFDGEPAWTLLITGPRVRSWGFWCPQSGGGERFVHWKRFVDPKDPGAIGPGCGA